MTMKLHLNYLLPNTHGGHTTGTVCGRENAQSDNGTNSTHVHADVTCAFCLKVIADKANWRHRKYIAKESV